MCASLLYSMVMFYGGNQPNNLEGEAMTNDIIKSVRDALEFYAKHERWASSPLAPIAPIAHDNGKTAREALAKLKAFDGLPDIGKQVILKERAALLDEKFNSVDLTLSIIGEAKLTLLRHMLDEVEKQKAAPDAISKPTPPKHEQSKLEG
jgi:hypothetical protein